MTQYSVESVASIRNKTKETIRVDQLLPEALREKSATLIGLLKDYYQYSNQVDNPSYEINSINNARDIDTADEVFLNKLQKEIAHAFPRTISADRLRLYKNLVQYYSLRGSAESIQLFFKIIFNDNAEIYYPREDLLIASDGVWDTGFQNLVYTKNPLVYVRGNGTGAYGEAVVEDGVITYIPVTNGGSNYTTAGVSITSATGTSATARAIIGAGNITGISIDVAGSGYLTAEVVISDSSGGTGSGAEAIAIIGSGGAIDQIYITNPGSGYSHPVASITGTQSSGGTAADLSATTNYRKIVSVEVTNGGKGYVSASASITGNGSSATLGTPTIKDGVITSVTVKDEGQNYTVASAEVFNDENAIVPSGGLTPAIIRPKVTVATPGLTVDPEDVGKIQSYQVVSGGEGYGAKGVFVGYTQGRYTDNRGFTSDLIRLQDSYFWQKYSYVVRTGNNIDSWKYVFDKLVHPAGFIYFGEILVLIELLAGRAAMPHAQPGLAGDAELTFKFIIELLGLGVTFNSSYYSSTLPVALAVPTTDLVRYEDPMYINTYSSMTIQQADGFSQETPVSPLYPWGDYTISYASGINTVNTINGVSYIVTRV